MNEELIRLVWRRSSSSCEYCRLPRAFTRSTFEIDHIIARKHGGAAVSDNLALACFLCNSFKGSNIAGVDPESGSITPLFHPRRQKWSRHFRWDGPLLIGRTAAGRATIAVLEINLPNRVVVRQMLIDEGVFPPP